MPIHKDYFTKKLPDYQALLMHHKVCFSDSQPEAEAYHS